MVYPTFTVNTKAFNIASNYGYSPYYDIVWSFDYAISGNNTTEAGFTVFLTDNNPLSGGNFNIDLGYSGLSSNSNQSSSIGPGVSGGVLAVGFDTTGLFAVSAISGTRVIRDGIDEAKRISNSISIRSKWPTYSYNTYAVNTALSSIDSSFKIVETSLKFKTIRARLGNIGRTLYIDYRNSPEEDFKPLLTQNVSLSVVSNTLYRVGASFATPVSSNKTSSVGVIYFKNFHTEGSFLSGDITTYTSLEQTECLPSRSFVPAVVATANNTEYLKNIVTTINNNTDEVCPTQNIVFGRFTTSNDIPSFPEDRFNFGYRLNIQNNTNTINTNLTRSGLFNYISDTTITPVYKVYKNTLCDYWMLSSNTSLSLTNLSSVPIGNYSPTISAKYI